jgi:hypothetical protein
MPRRESNLVTKRKPKSRPAPPMPTGYRVTVFVDMNNPPSCTDDVRAELEHAIKLYDQDLPIAEISISSIAPLPVATGPDGGKVA